MFFVGDTPQPPPLLSAPLAQCRSHLFVHPPVVVGIPPELQHAVAPLHEATLPVRYEPAFYSALTHGDHCVSVCAVDAETGALVAMATARIDQVSPAWLFSLLSWTGCVPMPSVRPEGYLMTLVVAETHRRRGIAVDLLQRVEDELTAVHGATVLRAHVARHNEPARALYRRTGFYEAAILPAHYLIKGRRVDGILLTKDLTLQAS